MSITTFLILAAIVCWVLGVILPHVPNSPANGIHWTNLGLVFFGLSFLLH